jgi:hypothetical protein
VAAEADFRPGQPVDAVRGDVRRHREELVAGQGLPFPFGEQKAEADVHGLGAQYYTDPGAVGGESNQASDAKLGANLWELSHTVVREKLGPDALLPWDAKK